jgi:hypothetical protein
MEVLEIANYAHTPTRPTDHWRNGGAGVRRRAGSTDVRLHRSFYMEADSEPTRVFDEAPPTDIEDGIGALRSATNPRNDAPCSSASVTSAPVPRR